MYRVIDKGDYILVKEWTWVARELDAMGRRALTFVEYYNWMFYYAALMVLAGGFMWLMYLLISRKD